MSASDWTLYVSSAGWYSLRYPPNWTVTEDPECATFCEPVAGVGAVQVSAYRAPEPQDPRQHLAEHLEDQGQGEAEPRILTYRLGRKAIAVVEFLHGASFVKVWFICQQVTVTMVTYICAEKDRDSSEAEIGDEIVASIALESQEQ